MGSLKFPLILRISYLGPRRGKALPEVISLMREVLPDNVPALLRRMEEAAEVAALDYRTRYGRMPKNIILRLEVGFRTVSWMEFELKGKAILKKWKCPEGKLRSYYEEWKNKYEERNPEAFMGLKERRLICPPIEESIYRINLIRQPSRTKLEYKGEYALPEVLPKFPLIVLANKMLLQRPKKPRRVPISVFEE